jgi:hypothetical protein
MYKHTHSLYAVLRGYHQLPSFSLTTLTNLVINLSLSLLSPSRYNPFKKGVISSGLHLARVRNKSANRIAGCKGRVWSGKGVMVGEVDVNFAVPSGDVRRCSPCLSADCLSTREWLTSNSLKLQISDHCSPTMSRHLYMNTSLS